MNSPNRAEKIGKIAFVVDERLSRERRHILSRFVTACRSFANFQMITGDLTEAELLKKLEAESFNLVLAPWYRYLAWNKVEAFYGLTRNSGPTFAGYFCEQMQPYELGDQAEHLRAILLDFSNMSVSESARHVRCLLRENTRSGILPLLEANTPVYCENWFFGQGLGHRIDAVLGLPEISNTEWTKRAPAIRILLSAFWGLVYEEGPGKSELTQATVGNKSPRAHFQVAADSNVLTLRLCYAMPAWSSKEVINQFWPNSKHPYSGAQTLLTHSDFLRVHSITDNQDLEIVAALYKSAPTETAHTQVHALWIEPLSAHLVPEIPFQTPGPQAPYLRALPGAPPAPDMRARAVDLELAKEGAQAKERFIFESAIKIRELRRTITQKEDIIKDLRMGGVGTAQPAAPPDAESLLEAFQERFFEARSQIEGFESQISEMELNGAAPREIELLKHKMNDLAIRERRWIQQIASTLQKYRNARKSAGGE